jgi:hypothetical protein
MRHTSDSLTKLLCGGFAAALIASVPLKAQDIEFKLGGMVSGALPASGLPDAAKAGFGATFFVEFASEGAEFERIALRPRVDYLKFGEKDWGHGATTNASSISTMVELTFNVSDPYKGFYFFAGLGFNRNALDIKVGSHSTTASEFTTGGSLGLGYDLNRHFGFEARYVRSFKKVESDDSEESTVGSSGFDWLQASLKLRF